MMAMNSSGDNWTNEQEKAAKSLEHVLSEETVNDLLREKVPAKRVEDAVEEAPLLEIAEERVRSRALFVSGETNILVADSPEQKYYFSLSKVFDEIHIVLPVLGKGKESVTRLTGNIWIYKVHSPYSFFLKRAALRVVRENLVFNGAIRPDLVVARDPFVAGMVGKYIAKKIKRPLQIHVLINPFNTLWLQKDKRNVELQDMAEKVLKGVHSLRAGSEGIEKSLKERYKKAKDVSVLPHYYNLNAYKDSAIAFNVHEKYPQYKFIMLAEGELVADSNIHDVITAARYFMSSPRIGLVILGDGPAKELFEEKVKILNLQKNVVFVTGKDDIISYYKTADLFIEAGTSAASEEHILRAVGAELPIVAYETDIRNDLFVEGDSAFMCEPHDSYCLTSKINDFLNNPALRTRFRKRSRNLTSDRIHEDEGAYFEALANSIEQVLFVGEESK
tara:strand:- start:2528 stop:3868 length:1341 start_codon:yes stop_codon:yes gene_type:complete